MSDITINQKNLSRFSKRLQKSLSKNFNQDVPLHLASLILAEALGVDSIYHLQKKIEEENKQEEIIIKEFIENYFYSNNDSKINGFTVSENQYNNSIIFNISTISKRDEELFSIFFGETISEFDKDINKLDLNKEDVKFIKDLIEKLHFNDLGKNIYLGLKIKDLLKLKDKNSYYSFKSNKNIEVVTNYGLCESLFAIVDINFFERVGAPYVFNNDKYVFIDLENNDYSFYKNIEDAIKKLDEDKMIIEFKTPLNQYSSLIKKSQNRVHGICSHYLYRKNNKNIASTVNLSYSQEINKISDYFIFYGKNQFNINPQFEINNVSINHEFKNEIQLGFEDAKKNLFIFMNKNKKK